MQQGTEIKETFGRSAAQEYYIKNKDCAFQRVNCRSVKWASSLNSSTITFHIPYCCIWRKRSPAKQSKNNPLECMKISLLAKDAIFFLVIKFRSLDLERKKKKKKTEKKNYELH